MSVNDIKRALTGGRTERADFAQSKFLNEVPAKLSRLPYD